MVQRIRDHKVHLKGERAKLPPRREPYWRHIDVGRHLGYRKTETGSETWVARFTDGLDKYHYKSLGSLAAIDWTVAKKMADEWFKTCQAGLIRAGTVEQVLRDYVKDRAVNVSQKNADDAEKRFKTHVYGTALARVALDKLTPAHIDTWRTDVLEASTPESTLRTFKVVRAALQRAFRLGEIQSDAAWKRIPLKAGTLAENALDLYWTIAERRAFLDTCPADLCAFLTAIGHTGARPQEIASALVEDFDPFTRTLTLRHRKGHRSALKARQFTLANAAALEFFKAQAKSKTPKAPLLSRSDGSSWYSDKDHGAWVAMLKRARRAGKFDDRVTAYHFRHWFITDALNAGIVAANVATLCGTSITMIDQFYKKFVKGAVTEQLKAMETA